MPRRTLSVGWHGDTPGANSRRPSALPGSPPARDRAEATPEELAANSEALRRAVLTLWQTSIVRRTRLAVVDEVENGLAYYDHTFLRELPGFYADLEDQLRSINPDWNIGELPSTRRRCGRTLRSRHSSND